MKVPEAVTLIADQFESECFSFDENTPNITKRIYKHSHPEKGWIIEMTLMKPHKVILPIMPTVQRLGCGSVSWDTEINTIIITGKVNDIEVSILVTQEEEKQNKNYFKYEMSNN